eukprot:TRINITY_DN10236_c0_g2_i6.p1 TRINITY_DN10236_c0_g2~~TRINITY_DN10236_c0_g2_i6.p1  ORF type:complete len:877 (+),score=126.13 TRINITY_DN10236_c0_g2_i6:60-2690(+)
MSSTDDGKLFQTGQGLVSVVNAPKQGQDSLFCWPSSLAPYIEGTWNETPPAIPPGLLPEIRSEDFGRYLEVIGRKYREFAYARQRLFEEHGPHVHVRDGISISQGEGLASALRQVPKLFFQDDFNLARLETFKEVCPQDREESMGKLQQYVDVVEAELQKEIAACSNSFFQVANQLHELCRTINLSCSQIDNIKHDLRNVDQLTWDKVQAVQELQTRRRNLMLMYEKLKMMEEIQSSQDALEILLPAADYAGSLDILESMQQMFKGEDMSRLTCFKSLGGQLEETTEAVDELMGQELLKASQFVQMEAAIDVIVARLKWGETLKEGEAMEFGEEETERLQESLLPVVVGLKRTGKLSTALQGLRETASQDMKSSIREIVERLMPALLEKSVPDDKLQEAQEFSLAQKLQCLSHNRFLALLEGVLLACKACANHYLKIGTMVEDALKQMKVLRSQLMGYQKDCQEVMAALLETAQGRWAKLLGTRTQVHAKISLKELKSILEISEECMRYSDANGGKQSASLKNALQLQCRGFLDYMHGHNTTYLQDVLQREVWQVAQVPQQFQDLQTQILILGADQDEDVRKKQEKQQNGTDNSNSNNKNNNKKDSNSGNATLTVVGLNFYVANALLLLIKMLWEYVEFGRVATGFEGEIMHRVIFLLKTYNSQTCTLVLGAGAMQSAGLKSITAKHLALSCQCVGVVITMQPYLQRAIMKNSQLPKAQFLTPELQRLQQDLVVHRDQIHQKLVTIMKERLQASLNNLETVAKQEWVKQKGEEASAWAQHLGKALRILKQVLAPLLQEEELVLIFGRVGQIYSDSLAEQLSQLQIPDGADKQMWSRQRMMDAQQLLESLRGLPLSKEELVPRLEALQQFCDSSEQD